MSVVVLCGSARHRSDFDEAARRLVRETTNTIVAPCWAFSSETLQEGDKERIVANNRRKIDLADVLLVIDSNGHIGADTQADIEYAKGRDIPIQYWSTFKQDVVGTAILQIIQEHGAPIARTSLWQAIRATTDRRTIQLAFQSLMSRGCIYETPDMKIAVVSDHGASKATAPAAVCSTLGDGGER